MLIRLRSVRNVNFTNGTALKSVQVDPSLLQCFFTVRRMQYNFSRYHFGLEWEKRKIVRRVRAKRILHTAPHKISCQKNFYIHLSFTRACNLHHSQVLKCLLTTNIHTSASLRKLGANSRKL